MFNTPTVLVRRLTTASALALGLVAAQPLLVLAAPRPYTSTAIEAVPPNVGVSSNNKPMMMLVASKDHTLFGPMYTDFEDLDGDGTIDVTFKPDFKYYGYFDATKCYVYNSTNKRFEPDTAVKVEPLKLGRYECGGSGPWAGHFLN